MPGRRQSDSRKRFLAQLRQFKQLGGTFVWTIHNLLPHDGIDMRKAAAFNRDVAAVADLAHVHSQWAAAEAGHRYGVPEQRIRVIEHPSYEGAYPIAMPGSDTRAKYGLNDTDFVLLCLGAMRPPKNVEALLEAIEELPEHVRAVIAGAPSRHPVPVETARATVISRSVSDQEVSDLFAMADFAVLTTERATTSGSLMLALTMGVPVIDPRLGPFTEVVSDGREGLFFSPDDISDLQRVIRTALDLPPWRHRAMRAAAAAAAAFRSPQAFAERISGMIREAIDLRMSED
jgi:glycosyltransferase involved in cell wall biosynthesis